MSLFADEATTQWAACISEGGQVGPVDCAAAVLGNLDAYFDVSGGEVHVYYPALLADLAACA